MSALSIQERAVILERELNKYIHKGWHIVYKNETSVQLSRDRRASCLLALILAFFLILPAILYLLLYRGTENIYIAVDEFGKVIIIRN